MISLLVHLVICSESRVAPQCESMHYFQHQEGLPANVCIYMFLFICAYICLYNMYIHYVSDFSTLSFRGTHKLITNILQHTKNMFFADL